MDSQRRGVLGLEKVSSLELQEGGVTRESDQLVFQQKSKGRDVWSKGMVHPFQVS